MQEHQVITIDGKDFLVEEGMRLLDFIKAEKLTFVPSICYNESLGPIETCDSCVVEVNGQLQRACSTMIENGMVVNTQLESVKSAQKQALDRVLEHHELYCTVCDYNNGNCEIHNTMGEFGLEHQSNPFQSKGYEKDFGAFYRYDPDQCILCGRCVEVCQDVQVNETLTIDWERKQPRVIWDNDRAIDESSCVNCGQCVTVCPCNALMENNMLGNAGYMTDQEPGLLRSMIELTKKAETGYGPLFAISDSEAAMREDVIKKTKTVCTYCGVGCSFDVWTKDREILRVLPHEDSPANHISTCVKGKFAWDYVNSEDRLTKPLVRKEGYFQEVEWDEALRVISTRFSQIKNQYGKDALAFISSSKCTNEESYLMQKLARQVIGTHNVDNCSRYCQSPATQGLFRTVGYGGDSGSIEDLEKAKMVITIGTNTAEAHPVIASRIKRAHKLLGQKLYVFDIRKHEMAERADKFYQPNPGTDLVWLSAVTKYIIDQNWHDEAFINKWVNDFDSYYESLNTFTLEYAESLTGISQTELKHIAKQVAETESLSICWAMGVTQHRIGSDTSTAISNLLLVTGNYMRPGTGAYPLRGHNNVQGCSDMGSMPNTFPGYQEVSDDEVRHKFEQAWQVSLDSERGLDNHQMIDSIHEGTLHSLYIKGEDTGVVDANINYVRSAFEKIDFLVVQDLFLSKTAEFADVVLPASPSLEKDGTFTNTERRVQRINKALDTLGDSKPDWEIIQLIAQSLGADWDYQHPSEIWYEAQSLMPLVKGITYDRLEGFDSLQWPMNDDGTDTPLLYTERFNFPDGKARLYPLSFNVESKKTKEMSLHVNNGRVLEHFHEGNMTYQVPGLKYKLPRNFCEISKELAEEHGIENGARVKITSKVGTVEVNVQVTDRVAGNNIYIPLNDQNEGAPNFVTDSDVDKVTNTPAYKDNYAKLEVVTKKGQSPIPKHNSRFGNRQPQISVRVQDKWAKSSYTFPSKGGDL
ncbi:formate dehydrogenase subunit alpha [Mammaliicoccus sciuri]|uniref:formate dehydrogenase subunit alpha n=1 Tax=Mammaliicoccus sciuri TaxID=1296 RepID=UPI001C6330A3|nr:formate dehydrogenase subunit alpha [Mammaliicoccus sciuri]QYG32440.1 formate dehydrogenase subunit alpha [Mammaliicoccus sciuri]